MGIERRWASSSRRTRCELALSGEWLRPARPLRADLVQHYGWITDQQLIDAIAMGQVTPGPVFATATFIGYLGTRIPGALQSTLGIFLLSFILVATIYVARPEGGSSTWPRIFSADPCRSATATDRSPFSRPETASHRVRPGRGLDQLFFEVFAKKPPMRGSRSLPPHVGQVGFFSSRSRIVIVTENSF